MPGATPIICRAARTTDPTFGDPIYPGLNKFINEFHDIRGNESIVPNASKVQLTLNTIGAGSTIAIDIEAILARNFDLQRNAVKLVSWSRLH